MKEVKQRIAVDSPANVVLDQPVHMCSASTHSKAFTRNLLKSSGFPVIGWREWVGLPEFDVKWIKVKVDTGARSSSLHAFDLRPFKRDGTDWVRFQIHPVQRKSIKSADVEAPVLEYRSVRSSSGKASVRPVIVTRILLLGQTWPIELTLASRDEMGFRMLLGREAIRGRYLVDAGNSYYAGKPKRKKRPKS